MTLVVSDISTHGVLLIGDSAATVTDEKSRTRTVIPRTLAKVFYSRPANIGLSAWGNFNVAGGRMDHWLQRFVGSLSAKETIDDAADRLAHELNAALATDYDRRGLCAAMRRGVHIAGYVKGIPHLYHVHTGHEDGPYRKLYVQRHYPDEEPDRQRFFEALERGLIQMRNGYFRDFVQVFDEEQKNSRFEGTLQQRRAIYERLFERVAALAASRGLPAVNAVTSVLAFTPNDVVIDRRIPVDGSEDINDWVSAGELLVA